MPVAKKTAAKKPVAKATPKAAEKPAGFFDTYEDEGGGEYLTGPEKDLLYEEETIFLITGVSGPGNTGYEGKSRFVLQVEIEGEPKLMGLDEGSVFSRDRQLLAIQDWLHDGGDAVEIRLDKAGRSWILVDPNA